MGRSISTSGDRGGVVDGLFPVDLQGLSSSEAAVSKNAHQVNFPGRSFSSSGDRMATQAGARKVSTTASFSGSSVTVRINDCRLQKEKMI